MCHIACVGGKKSAALVDGESHKTEQIKVIGVFSVDELVHCLAFISRTDADGGNSIF